MSNSPSPELTLAAKIEAMLFVSAEPVPVAQLATALDVNSTVVERGLKELEESPRCADCACKDIPGACS